MENGSFFEKERKRYEEDQKKRTLLEVIAKLFVPAIFAVGAIIFVSQVIIKNPKAVINHLYFVDDNLYYQVEISKDDSQLNNESIEVVLEWADMDFELDSRDEYIHKVSVGTQNNFFSNLKLGREYVLKVKGSWGYGKGTITERRIKFTEDYTARIFEVGQNGLNINYKVLVVDQYEKLTNDEIVINFYQDDELVDSTLLSISSYDQRAIDLTLESSITTTAINYKVEILNNQEVLDTYLGKVDTNPIFVYPDFFVSDFEMMIGGTIIDSFDKIDNKAVFIEIYKEKDRIYKRTVNLLDIQGQSATEHYLSEMFESKGYGIYKILISCDVDFQKVLLYEDIAVNIPFFEFHNLEIIRGSILRFNLINFGEQKLTVNQKNKLKLEVDLFEERTKLIQTVKVDSFELSGYFKNVDPNINYTLVLRVKYDGFEGIGAQTEYISNPIIEPPTVTFMFQGGTMGGTQDDYYQIVIENGGVVDRSQIPTVNRDNYRFVMWSTSEIEETQFDFATPIFENIFLYAVWEPIQVEGLQITNLEYDILTNQSSTINAEITGFENESKYSNITANLLARDIDGIETSLSTYEIIDFTVPYEINYHYNYNEFTYISIKLEVSYLEDGILEAPLVKEIDIISFRAELPLITISTDKRDLVGIGSLVRNQPNVLVDIRYQALLDGELVSEVRAEETLTQYVRFENLNHLTSYQIAITLFYNQKEIILEQFDYEFTISQYVEIDDITINQETGVIITTISAFLTPYIAEDVNINFSIQTKEGAAYEYLYDALINKDQDGQRFQVDAKSVVSTDIATLVNIKVEIASGVQSANVLTTQEETWQKIGASVDIFGLIGGNPEVTLDSIVDHYNIIEPTSDRFYYKLYKDDELIETSIIMTQADFLRINTLNINLEQDINYHFEIYYINANEEHLFVNKNTFIASF